MRIRGFPFSDEVARFIDTHDFVFVVEQNRDAQMKTLLVNEAGVDPHKIVSVLSYGGLSITARRDSRTRTGKHYDENNLARLTEVSGGGGYGCGYGCNGRAGYGCKQKKDLEAMTFVAKPVSSSSQASRSTRSVSIVGTTRAWYPRYARAAATMR